MSRGSCPRSRLSITAQPGLCAASAARCPPPRVRVPRDRGSLSQRRARGTEARSAVDPRGLAASLDGEWEVLVNWGNCLFMMPLEGNAEERFPPGDPGTRRRCARDE